MDGGDNIGAVDCHTPGKEGDVVSNEELVQLYQQGDSNALEELLEQNKGVVYKVAKKFYTGGINSIDMDDLIQEGNIGLILAAQKYDFFNEKKACFITYAYFWIHQHMHRFIGKNDTNEEVSINAPVTKDDGTLELADTLQDNKNYFELLENELDNELLRADIDKVLRTMTLKERNVILMRYGLDSKLYTHREISEILGESRHLIRNIEARSLRKLRKSNELKKYESYYIKLRKEQTLIHNLNCLDTGKVDKYNFDLGIKGWEFERSQKTRTFLG